MLGERSYMQFRDDYGKSAREAMQCVWVLIGINAATYLLNIGENGALYLWANEYKFHWYQLVTYMFFHDGFGHIFFNMYGIYLFGGMVAPILGRTRFLILYFLSGIGGALLHLAANWGDRYPTVGASGALFGIMLAAAMLRPNTEIFLLFIPVPIKLKTMVIVYAVLEILSSGKLDNIAHLAHLGGFVGAYLYLIIFCKRDVIWSLKDLFKGIGGSAAGKTFDRNGPSGGSGSGAGATGSPQPHITHVTQQEVDRLLDKISQEGINSLTDYERAELQYFREQMQSRGR